MKHLFVAVCSLFLIMAFILKAGVCISGTDSVVIPETVVNEWGYRTTNSFNYMPDFCDPNIKREAQVVYQGIKSKREVYGLKYTYYRFTLIKEIYPNTRDAIKRLFLVNNPPRKSTKHEKLCYLRKGFRVDNTIFIVVTDSTRFYDDELDNILGKAKTYQTNHGQ
jgi:hypothetical protein